MRNLLQLTFVLCLVLGVTSFNGRRIRRNEVKVLSVKTLADGTKFEEIQESGILPALPIDEEIDDINDERVGKINEYGDILVPVDEHGNIVKGYEYLLKPIYVDISVDENDIASPESSHLNLPQNPSNLVYKTIDRSESGEDVSQQEQQQQQQQPEVPPLPAVDYSDSGESDENLKPDPNEIDVPRNDQVLVPVKEIDAIPIQYSSQEDEVQEEPQQIVENSESENQQSPESEVDLSEEGIQAMAEEMSRGVLDHVLNKSSEFWESQNPEAAEKPWRIPDTGRSEPAEEKEENEQKSIGSESLDGFVLEEPTSEEIEIGVAEPEKDIIRGQIGLVPDSSTTSQFSKILLIFVMFFVTF